MNEHYSEADLLETYYTQPGQSMPVMMHLAQCDECVARYERLERKLRDLASCETKKPETFWQRQRLTIMSRLEHSRRPVRAPLRIAAAAILALVLGGVVLQRSSTRPVEPQTVQDTTVPSDPWDSDELKDYGAVVEWESWIEEEKKTL
jgi:predicted anti-sigma-YlaC factor YlaD